MAVARRSSSPVCIIPMRRAGCIDGAQLQGSLALGQHALIAFGRGQHGQKEVPEAQRRVERQRGVDLRGAIAAVGHTQPKV